MPLTQLRSLITNYVLIPSQSQLGIHEGQTATIKPKIVSQVQSDQHATNVSTSLSNMPFLLVDQ